MEKSSSSQELAEPFPAPSSSESFPEAEEGSSSGEVVESIPAAGGQEKGSGREETVGKSFSNSHAASTFLCFRER